ncbi:hypothetical protein ES708_19373 [subsurface metagenome]
MPKAKAAIAWAPPAQKIRSTRAISAATRVDGETVPLAPGGVVKTISLTPATLAGIAVINTVDG